MTYKISFTVTAREMLRVHDRNVRVTILEKIKGLAHDPEKQGKALTHSLRGLRSIRAAGRYRVVYQVERSKVIVLVLAIGLRKENDRKDIYQLAKRLIKLGLLEG